MLSQKKNNDKNMQTCLNQIQNEYNFRMKAQLLDNALSKLDDISNLEEDYKQRTKSNTGLISVAHPF